MPSIVWKGHLTFGLVSIPVKLFRAARRERVRLHYVHRPESAEPRAIEPVHREFINYAAIGSDTTLDNVFATARI
jgi:non-homologous end joining protein Ku